MQVPILSSVKLAGATVASLVAVAAGDLTGASAIKACAGAGPYWPTMTLALDGNSAWVACKEQMRLVRVNSRTGKRTATLRLGTPVIAVVAGYRSIWALGTNSTLYRIRPNKARVIRRISLPLRAPYNIWVGGGSIWIADDQGGEVTRISPATNRVVRRIPVDGDGPSDMAFGAGEAWVISHRDGALTRIDLRTNAHRRVATIPGDAPERMVRLGSHLWITGRGTDLLQVNPDTGAVVATVDIGASGIDVAATADALWVPARSPAVDASGLPTMEALRKVSASTHAVSTVSTATGRVDVHGIAVRGDFLWLADNRSGLLYRIKT